MAMNQKTRSLVSLGVLLVATAGVALYAYLGVHQKGEAEKVAKEQKAKLFDAERSSVLGLTVEAKGQTTTLQRAADGSWEILSPVHAPAEAPTVDALVDRLLGLKSKAVVEPNAADLAKFGLDTPSIAVFAKLDGGRQLTLRSGAESAFDNSVYVVTNDSKDVIQAEGGFKWALEKDTFDLRDKRVVTFEDAAVREVDVRVGQTHYAAKKTEAGAWELTAPVAGRADAATVAKVISTMRNLRSLRFVSETASPEDLKRWGLHSPKGEATVVLEGGKKVALQLAQLDDNGEKSFAHVGDAITICEVANAVFDELNLTPDDLRDKTLVRFDRDAVKAMALHFGDETLVAHRAGPADAGAPETWSFAAPATAKPRDWKLSALLNGLALWKGASVVDEHPTDLARFGLDKPARSIELVGADGAALATVAVGKEDGDKVYARGSTDPRVLALERSKIRDWPTTKAELEEPAAAPAPPPPGR